VTHHAVLADPRSPGTCAIAVVVWSLGVHAAQTACINRLPPCRCNRRGVQRVETTLAYLGQPLSAQDRGAIDEASAMADQRRSF
jgi:hypothetical protein